MPPKPIKTTISVPHPLPSSSSITRDQIIQLAAAYEEVASRLNPRPGKRAPPQPPEPLEDLDAFRWKELPDILAKRRGGLVQEGGAFLRKAELERLMNWKLHRGIFRPTLPALIKANTEDAVEDATLLGLTTLQSSLSTISTSIKSKSGCPAAPIAALDQICALRGIGPATASLIFSCASPDHMPFLSDDLYEWLFGERPLKYDKKEWKALWEAIWELRIKLVRDAEAIEPMNVRDIERAGTVISWTKQGRLKIGAEGKPMVGAQEKGDHESKLGEAKALTQGKKRARQQIQDSNAELGKRPRS